MSEYMGGVGGVTIVTDVHPNACAGMRECGNAPEPAECTAHRAFLLAACLHV
jgi:hypothetical protein